jgi:hypothetical protein
VAETETLRLPEDLWMAAAPLILEKVIGASMRMAGGRRSEGEVTSSGR